MSREQYLTCTHLEDVDERHHLVDDILDLADIVVGLEHSGSKAALELCLDCIGELL